MKPELLSRLLQLYRYRTRLRPAIRVSKSNAPKKVFVHMCATLLLCACGLSAATKAEDHMNPIRVQPWNLTDPDPRLKSLADEIDALSKDSTPATTEYVLKLLELTEEFRWHKSQASAYEGIRRANMVFPALSSQDKQAVTVPMLKCVANLTGHPFYARRDVLLSDVLEQVESLNPPAGREASLLLLNISSGLSLRYPDEAQTPLECSVRLFDRFGSPSSDTATVHYQLGDLYRKLSKYSEAEAQLTKAQALVQQESGLSPMDGEQIASALADVYKQLGKKELNELLARRSKVHELDATIIAVTSLIHQGKYDVAIPNAVLTMPNLDWQGDELGSAKCPHPVGFEMSIWAHDLREQCALQELDRLCSESVVSAKRLGKGATHGFAQMCAAAAKEFMEADNFSLAEKYAMEALGSRYPLDITPPQDYHLPDSYTINLFATGWGLSQRNQTRSAQRLFTKILEDARDEPLRHSTEIASAMSALSNGEKHPHTMQYKVAKRLILKNISSSALENCFQSMWNKGIGVPSWDNSYLLVNILSAVQNRTDITTQLEDAQIARLLAERACNDGDARHKARLDQILNVELKDQRNDTDRSGEQYFEALREHKENGTPAYSIALPPRQSSSDSAELKTQVAGFRSVAPIRKIFGLQTSDGIVNSMIDETDAAMEQSAPVDIAFVQKLLDLSMQLKRIDQPLVARAMVAAADDAFSDLSSKEQDSIIYPLVAAAAGMPIVSSRTGCLVHSPSRGGEPLLTKALPVIDSMRCASFKQLASKLSQVRNSYVAMGYDRLAIPVSDTAADVYDHFFPHSADTAREHFELAKILLPLAPYVLGHYSEAKSQIDKALKIADKGRVPEADKAMMIATLAEIYARMGQTANLLKLLSQNHKLLIAPENVEAGSMAVYALITAGQYGRAVNLATTLVPNLNWNVVVLPLPYYSREKPTPSACSEIDNWAQALQRQCQLEQMDKLYTACLNEPPAPARKHPDEVRKINQMASDRFLNLKQLALGHKYAERCYSGTSPQRNQQP